MTSDDATGVQVRPFAPNRVRRLVLTGVLAGAALLGNVLSLPVGFGVDFLFGSIAVMLALARLGTGPALVVALVGGGYTWLLWGHPYSLLIFLAEAVVVGWHRDRARRRGLTPPPLAVSVALFWLLLGAPLALLAHGVLLGLDWTPTLLIAIKQSQNGILNAALADLILVIAVLLTRRSSVLPLAQVLFGVLLAAMLLPTLLVNAWENRNLKTRLETALAEQLRPFGELAVHQLAAQPAGETVDSDWLRRQLQVMRNALVESLPASFAPQLRLERGAATAFATPPSPPLLSRVFGGRPAPGQIIPTSTPGLSLIAPTGHYAARIAFWRQTVYSLELPVHPIAALDGPAAAGPLGTPPQGYRLVMELRAAPLIDQLQAAAATLLLSLFAVTLLGLVVAYRLSRRIARPLHRLAQDSRALPEAIRAGRPWPALVPGLLAETGEVADAVSAMARSLAASFRGMRESEQRFRTLVETMAEGVVYQGADGAITDANPAAGRLLGLSFAQLQGRDSMDPRWQAVRPDGRPFPGDEHPAMVALRTGEDPGETVMGVVNPQTGATRWLLIHAHPEVRPGESRPYRVFTTFADITELKQIEERLRTLIDISPHGIVEADPLTRRVLWCNGSMLRLFGYAAAELQALSVDDLHPVESLPVVLSEFARMAGSDLGPAPDLPCRHRDGSTFYCKVSPGRMRLGQGATLVAYFTDVTTERTARLALERAQESLLRAQEIARLGSWEFDLVTGGLIWSPEVFRIFGQDPERFTPGFASMLAGIHPEDRALLERTYRESVASRTPYELLHRLLLPDGRVKWVQERAETEYAGDGTPLKSRGTTQDVTERTVAELALADQRQRLANIIAATRVATWEWEFQTGTGTVNERWAEIVGYRLEELAPVTLQTWMDLTHPDDLKRSLDLVERHRRGDLDGYECELRMRHKDGHWVWVLAQGRVMEWDAAGAPRLMSGIAQDISERRLARERLQESEERFAAIFSHAPIAMTLVGPDRRLILGNRALAAFLGRSLESLIGQCTDDLGHPDDHDQDSARLAAFAAGRVGVLRMTRRYPRPDGSVAWGDLRAVLLTQRSGELPLFLGMIEDVTELRAVTQRRQALEAAVSHYNLQLEELVDVISLPLPPAEQISTLLWLGCHSLGGVAAVLALVDEDGANQVLLAARDDGGGAAPPVLDRILLEEALTHLGSPCVLSPDRLPGAVCAAGLRCGVAMAFHCPRPDDGGDTLVLSLWGRGPTLDLTGPGAQIVRLIAQRIAAVRYQEQVQQDLVAAKGRETIGHLASGIAHDFNNLLGVIDANIYYLEGCLGGLATVAPDLRQVFEETQSALGQAKVITSGMLSLSRAGGVPLELVDLGSTVAELEGILRHILPAGIDLRVAVPGGLMAWTNDAFLQSALLNLALNARDAMPDGGVLAITAAPAHWAATTPLAVGRLPSADGVTLRVSDTGSGIAPGLLPRVFDPLFSTKAKQRGHGLGLFMVQEFVVRSGAGLAVASQSGRGTCFSVFLPGVAPAAAAAPSALPAPGPDGARSAPLAGLRVLVVEDDPRVREAVGRLLTLEGVRLGQAEHGQAGLDLLERDAAFDLVLSDIAMPVLDGIQLQQRLARERPGLPVILMTGQKDALSALDDLPEPPTVLRKPLDPLLLRGAILAALGARPGGGAASASGPVVAGQGAAQE